MGLGHTVRVITALTIATWRDAVRQRLLLGLALGMLALVLLLRAAGALDLGGAGGKVAVDFAHAAVAVFGLALAVVLTVQQVHDEWHSGRLEALWAKPLTRAEWLIGKWCGLMVVLAGFALLGAGLVWSVARGSENPVTGELWGDDRVLPRLEFSAVAAVLGLQWLKWGVLSAAALVLAAAVRSLNLAIVLALGVALAGHLQPFAVSLSAGGGAGSGWRALIELWPNLLLFEPTQGLGEDTFGFAGLARRLAYGGCYIVGCLTAAALLLRQRDV